MLYNFPVSPSAAVDWILVKNKPFPPQPDDQLDQQFPEALSTYHLIKADKGMFSHHSRPLSGVQTLDWTGQGLLKGDRNCHFLPQSMVFLKSNLKTASDFPRWNEEPKGEGKILRKREREIGYASLILTPPPIAS